MAEGWVDTAALNAPTGVAETRLCQVGQSTRLTQPTRHHLGASRSFSNRRLLDNHRVDVGEEVEDGVP